MYMFWAQGGEAPILEILCIFNILLPTLLDLGENFAFQMAGAAVRMGTEIC